MAADLEYMKKQLISMDYHDITKSFVEENFARYYDTTTKKIIDPKFPFNGKITLNKGDLENVHSKIETNLGRLLVNKFLFTDGLMHVVPFVNEPITNKVLKKFEQLIRSIQ